MSEGKARFSRRNRTGQIPECLFGRNVAVILPASRMCPPLTSDRLMKHNETMALKVGARCGTLGGWLLPLYQHIRLNEVQ